MAEPDTSRRPRAEGRGPVERAVGSLERTPGRLLLAVSGGADSVALLEAAARVLPRERLVVATFDHGTGPAATRAARLVVRRARALGLPAVAGRARGVGRSEAAWRRARWAFLRAMARAHDATVVTAHTRDDQAETVLLRALRDAGPRGLAGLAAPGAVRRPLLGVTRAQVRAYLMAVSAHWLEDPTNRSLAYRRNRVRHELLPALRAARPAIDDTLVAIGARAARWRRDVERATRALARARPGAADVATADLAGYDRAALGVLWPAIAARAGLVLDRRGTERLVEFTIDAAAGASMPLAGGWMVVRTARTFRVRRAAGPAPGATTLPAAGVVRWGRWSFRAAPGDVPSAGADDAWRIALGEADVLTVRAWAPGDRMRGPDGRPRRVKRFLRDAGVPGPVRRGWPVVTAGAEILWIPGVRRSVAATERSGRPGLTLHSEFDDWSADGPRGRRR